MLNRKTPPPYNPNAEITLARPEKYTLNNGIETYMFASDKQDILLLEMIFTAGSKYQSKPFTALGTNSMLREGTKKYTAQQIAEEIEFYGSRMSCMAERDFAYVSLFTLTKHLDKALPLLNEVVRNPIFPKAELKIIAQKQKQLLEINKEKGSFLARAYFNRLLFGENHFYGTVMEPEDINNLTVDDLLDFHQKYYHAENCKIMLVGNVPTDIKDRLNQTLGLDWAGEKRQQATHEITPAANKLNFITKPDAKQSAIRMGRMLVNRDHPDFWGLRVLNTILGGYFGSRLMMNLREDKGYTYGIGSGIVSLQQAGYQIITSEVGGAVTQKAYEEIRKELNALSEQPVAEEELEVVRNYMMGELMRSMDGAFAQAAIFKEFIESDLDMNFLLHLKNTIQNIDVKSLRHLAQKYYKPEDFYTLIVGAQNF